VFPVRTTLAAAVCAAVAAACAPSRVAQVAPAAPAMPAPAATAAAAAADLPEGRGKQILNGACTSCHDLREVTKFRGYYDRAQWRDIVVTMVEYGAPVDKTDVEVLVGYLEEHLGRRVSASKP
jgi:cytochrome c5